MIRILFPYADSIIRKFPYGEQLIAPFPYPEKLDIKMRIQAFPDDIVISSAGAMLMRLIHETLVLGLDRMTLGQIDTFTIGMIDSFPFDM